MAKKHPFILPLLPPRLDLTALIPEIGRANHALGQLNGLMASIQNPDLLTTPLLTKEAVLSSRIEGTQASLEDVLHYEASAKTSQEEELEKDIREILNYRRAMRIAIRELEKKPIGSNFIKRLHSVLLDSVRGSSKDRGNFRKVQVFIGRAGTTMDSAIYVPPAASEISRLMGNWEKYVHDTRRNDILVMSAVAHYQFEAIHPFLDGNGRVGRLLIPLLLYEQGIISYPMLYISQYFEERRSSYYKLLGAVSKEKAWEDWIEYFLIGVRLQAERTQVTVKAILSLYGELKERVITMNSQYGIRFLDTIFASPIFSFNSVRDVLGTKAHQTVYNLIEKFTVHGIINESGDKQRNRKFEFPALLCLLQES
jgi:Fic family protein